MKKTAKTVKRRLLFIFSLALSFYCMSQEQDTAAIEIKRTVAPSLYLDYGKLFTIPFNFETKYEGGLELLFMEKFPLIAEVGQATLSPEGAYSNGTYESEGYYYRIGTGYYSQFLTKSKIGLTFRYASATFSEDGRIFIESPTGTQNNFVQNIVREDLKATWYEVVLYSDQRLSDLFTIGVNIRLRYLADYDDQSPVDVYAIPGYGRAFDKTIPAVNFFLKVTL